jgi:DNA polymerase I
VKKLIILDGHAIIHRAFHAIQPLHTSQGELVNAIFGFTSMMLNVLEIEKPDYIAVALDKKGKTFRHHADENYKGTRSKTDPNLISQIGRIYEIIRAFSIPLFAESGFEADDLIASICEKMKNENNLKIIIVSGDRDLLQLVDEKISLHDLSGGYRKSVNFTPAEVIKKYGFPQKYIADFKSLAGDASDNIKGVSGIGEKIASGLIVEFGNLKNIYANLNKIKESTRTKLEHDKENAFSSKMLATLRNDAQIDFDLNNCRLANFDRDTVLKLFTELEFHSLSKRFEKLFPLSPIIKAEDVQMSLF